MLLTNRKNVLKIHHKIDLKIGFCFHYALNEKSMLTAAGAHKIAFSRKSITSQWSRRTCQKYYKTIYSKADLWLGHFGDLPGQGKRNYIIESSKVSLQAQKTMTEHLKCPKELQKFRAQISTTYFSTGTKWNYSTSDFVDHFVAKSEHWLHDL